MSAPNDEREGGQCAPELATCAHDRELNAMTPARQNQPVNDLTLMEVKKKKKAHSVPEVSDDSAKPRTKNRAYYGERARDVAFDSNARPTFS